MPSVLVDSNVLIDVLTQDDRWFAWSAATLAQVAERNELVINPIIFAEVSIRFTRIEELDEALPREFFVREALPWEAGFLAGKAFLQYRRKRGPRTATLPDFFIGAHAAIAGHALLTRDVRRYATYFPSVRLIRP
jgi:predicted nucleic acid-binding protein